MINTKTTAVRVIPAIGKQVGDVSSRSAGCSAAVRSCGSRPAPRRRFINRGGRIPAPIQSLKN